MSAASAGSSAASDGLARRERVHQHERHPRARALAQREHLARRSAPGTSCRPSPRSSDFGPLMPMLVPSPPLSLSTTALVEQLARRRALGQLLGVGQHLRPARSRPRRSAPSRPPRAGGSSGRTSRSRPRAGPRPPSSPRTLEAHAAGRLAAALSEALQAVVRDRLPRGRVRQVLARRRAHARVTVERAEPDGCAGSGSSWVVAEELCRRTPRRTHLAQPRRAGPRSAPLLSGNPAERPGAGPTLRRSRGPAAPLAARAVAVARRRQWRGDLVAHGATEATAGQWRLVSAPRCCGRPPARRSACRSPRRAPPSLSRATSRSSSSGTGVHAGLQPAPSRASHSTASACSAKEMSMISAGWPSAGGEVHHAARASRFRRRSPTTYCSTSGSTSRASSPQRGDVDLDVEVPGVGQHRAVLHPREVLGAEHAAERR